MKRKLDRIFACIILLITCMVSGYIIVKGDTNYQIVEEEVVSETTKETKDEVKAYENAPKGTTKEEPKVIETPKTEQKVEVKQETKTTTTTPKAETKQTTQQKSTTTQPKSTPKTTTTVKSNVAVTGISVSVPSITLKVGETAKVTTTITPSNATNTNTVWSNSNPKVAKVSNKVITALSAGTTTITVKTADGGKTATIKVTVVNLNTKTTTTTTPKTETKTTTQPKTTTTTTPKTETKPATIAATGVTVSKTSVSLYVGDSATVTATVNPSNTTNKTVSWKSNNTSIATVNNGTIKGVKAGTTTVTVSTSNGKVANVQVTVSEKKVVTTTTQPKTTTPTTVAVTKITLNNTKISLNTNGKTTLTATISPSNATDKTVTWTTSNPIVARVDQSGNVIAVSPGTATITVKSKNGVTATSTVTVTSSNKTIAKYDSTSLKYWVEYVSEPTRSVSHKSESTIIQNQPTYMITHIWVSDAYNQVKTAITEKKSSTQTTEYPRKVQAGSTIINNEIKSKGYTNKGLVAVNASGMVTHTKNSKGEDTGWCTVCPLDYYGTSIMPLQINNGFVIRDSTNTAYATIGGGLVGYIDKNGTLAYKRFTSNLESNKSLRSAVSNDGAKYTFGMITGVLVENGKATQKFTNAEESRQAVCQIDKNNFVLITSHLNGGSAESNHNSCGTSRDIDCPRYKHGLNFSDIQRIMINLGCKTGFNLDGGGSISYYYKYNNSSTATRVKIAAAERSLSDVLYFVEK